MSDIAIDFQNVWKKYKKGERFDSLRDLIPAMTKRIFSGNHRGELEEKEFWAVKDVSFQVKKGEVLGIIGPNGAGKSTILKLLSGILRPNKGRTKVNGRLSALIEVGAGFHQDLTGRENIYLNGAILGMTKKEIDKKFDEIVEFSGLEEFIDTPVKRYSSGMYARLGFSVASHVDPEILLVDEVLSVGDASFQKKCSERIKKLLKKEVSLILVSHNLELLNNLCSRALLLAKGQIMSIGNPLEITKYYRNNVLGMVENKVESNVAGITFTNISLCDENGNPREHFSWGDGLMVHMSYEASLCIGDPTFSLVITSIDSTICIELATSYEEFDSLHIDKGKGTIELLMHDLRLTEGLYFISVAIGDRMTHAQYDFRQNICQFKFSGYLRGRGVLTPVHEWKFYNEL